MRPNKIKEMWRDGKFVTLGWLSVSHGFTAEVMARQGFDALCVDMQHGTNDMNDVWPMLQAISQTDTVPVADETEDDLVTLHLEELTDTTSVTGLIAEELEAAPDDDMYTVELNRDADARVSESPQPALDEPAGDVADTAVPVEVAPTSSTAATCASPPATRCARARGPWT